MKQKQVVCQEYVAGFLFSGYKNKIALILKNKPKWQAGKYNAIGGKIEPGETPLAAMRREFKEEAGVDIKKWHHYVTLQGAEFKVYFFWAADGAILNLKSMTSEKVEVFNTDGLPANSITNVRWLVEMALAAPFETVASLVVNEVAA